jgi:hypothetical protein
LDAVGSFPGDAAAVDGGTLASAVDDGIALVACLADTLCLVELTAEIADLAADSVLIEVVSLRALQTLVFAPGLASEVVGHFDKGGQRDSIACGIE